MDEATLLTAQDVADAANAAHLTKTDLVQVLSFAAGLVTREKLRAMIMRKRAEQTAGVQASEAEIQVLQAQFDAVEAQLAAQS